MKALSRIVSAARRLVHRGRRPVGSDSFGVVLAAASETGAVVTIPGLLHWLGQEQRPVDPDFKASIDAGFTESYEAFCARISKEPA